MPSRASLRDQAPEDANYNGPPPDSYSASDAAEHLAEAVYEARLDAGLSQEQLADLCGTSQSVVSYLERGRYPGIGLRLLTRVADELDLRVRLVAR